MRARSVLAFCLLGACACTAEAEPGLPPVTHEPSYPLFSSPEPAPDGSDAPAAASPDRKPRLVLQAILRGAGAGRKTVCGWVAPAHAKTRFSASCPRWVAALPPEDRAKLRKVKVPSATPGSTPKEWIVDPAALVWPVGEPASLPAAPYVLRLKGNRWTLVG